MSPDTGKDTSQEPFALIVDDDPVESRLMETALKKLGIPSESFSNSREFLARLKTAQPALCFIDLNIERKGVGYTIIEAVRKVRGWDPVLIVFSGETSAEAVAHAMEVGADDFLTKPLILKALAERVSQYVSTPELRERSTQPKPLKTPDDAQLELDVTLTRIDELGVQVKGPHLLPKGLVMRLSGGPLAEATGRDDGVLVTIVSTTVEASTTDGTRGYVATGEFDSTDERLLNAVRGWLTANR